MRLLILLVLSVSAFASQDFAKYVEEKLKNENPQLHHQYQMEFLADSPELNVRLKEVVLQEFEDPNSTWQQL